MNAMQSVLTQSPNHSAVLARQNLTLWEVGDFLIPDFKAEDVLRPFATLAQWHVASGSANT